MVNHVPEIILNKSIVVTVSCVIIIILKSVLWIIQGCHVKLELVMMMLMVVAVITFKS
jgi:hypothetical protein